MECLQIDWKNLDHTFERDDFYESIQAPKWIDFTAPLQAVDDHEWFCGKSGCTHAKELSWQPPEDPLLTDPQENPSLQAFKKVPPLAESTLSAAAGKRAREVVSSSYSSVSSIKEAFLKHKSLNGAKTSVVESNKQALKRSMPASENQNPNQACEGQPAVSKIPILKATEFLAKKLKTTEHNHISGKSESTMLSEQRNRSQTRAVLDVAKSTTLIGRKDLVLRKSTVSRLHAKEHKSDAKEEETAAPTITHHTSEPKSKRADASRTPFSVYTSSRSALTSSLALPPRRPANPARSIQNVQLDNEKPALCRPPRVVVRKDHKIKVERALMPNTQPSADNVVSSHARDHASTDNGSGRVESITNQPILQGQCSLVEHDAVHQNSLECDDQRQQDCRGDEENEKDMHVLVTEQGQSDEMTLEKHLESLCLSTPGNKPTSNGNEHLEHTDDSQKQEVYSERDESLCVNSSVFSQCEHSTLACEMKHSSKNDAGQEEVLITDYIQSRQFVECPPQINRTLPIQHETLANDAQVQMNKSSVNMHLTEKQDLFSNNKKIEKRDNQLQPVKDWQRSRGLKRKSSELNLKVNCSAKDHRHGSHKVTSSVTFASSLLCQQAREVLMACSPLKALPSHGCLDSCKEQHKKMKTTKVQPFKPFRLRTEERGALRELGLGKKEQGVSNAQEIVHHALRMPSFGHPFRPQRSTKKLTIPKEPNFHTTRTRKACPSSHHTMMITSQS